MVEPELRDSTDPPVEEAGEERAALSDELIQAASAAQT